MRIQLKTLQNKRGLTNREMCDIGEVSYVTYYRILTNKDYGSFLFWMKIKTYFKLSDKSIIEIAQENIKTKGGI